MAFTEADLLRFEEHSGDIGSIGVMELVREIREQRALLQAVANSTPENVMVAHAEGRVLLAFSRENFAGFPPDAAKEIAARLIEHAFQVDGTPHKIIKKGILEA